MDDHGQFSITKKAAIKIAGKVLSSARAYRAAAESGMAALKVLPHFVAGAVPPSVAGTTAFASSRRHRNSLTES